MWYSIESKALTTLSSSDRRTTSTYLRHASVEGFKEIEITELEYWITLIIDSLVCLFVFAAESWTLESAESFSLAYLIITP